MAAALSEIGILGFPSALNTGIALPNPSFLKLPSRSYLGNRFSKKQAQSRVLHMPELRIRNASGIRSAQITDLKQSSVGVGPRGMLLVGFSKADGDTVAAWMQQMEPEFSVSHCTRDMLKGTVQEAVCQGDLDRLRVEGHTVVEEPLPRLVILSGMSGEETIAIAEHWEMFTGTSPPIIATLVDKLLQRSLQDAILDIVKSFSISKSRSKNMADTSGLREMIKKKLDQRQAQAGRRLISRDAQSFTETEGSQPAVHVQQMTMDGPPEAKIRSSRIDQEQQERNAQQQVQELRPVLPKRSQIQKGAAERRDQKPKREKRGFG